MNTNTVFSNCTSSWTSISWALTVQRLKYQGRSTGVLYNQFSSHVPCACKISLAKSCISLVQKCSSQSNFPPSSLAFQVIKFLPIPDIFGFANKWHLNPSTITGHVSTLTQKIKLPQWTSQQSINLYLDIVWPSFLVCLITLSEYSPLFALESD